MEGRGHDANVIAPGSAADQQTTDVSAAGRGRVVRWQAAVRRALEHRGAGAVVVGVSLLLGCASITAGLGADDHIHELILEGEEQIRGWSRGPLDLFSFADGNPAHARALMDEGVFPWWADPEVKIAFFRPLASFTHWVDYKLWPEAAWMMHVHSLLWFVLMLGLVYRLYGRLIEPRWLAMLAFVLFALDDARAPPIAWVANRHALVAATGAVGTLLLHHRWRHDGSRASGWLAPVVLAIGLLGGEAAVSVGGYLLGYAVFLDRGSWGRRVASLAPYVLLGVVWRLLYVALGYGVHGSGVYIDPTDSPLAYLEAAFVRIPVLWLSQWALPWSELWTLYPHIVPGVEQVVWMAGVALVAATLAVLVPLSRKDPTVGFWALGAACALLPPAATFPADRLLTMVAIGAMPLLAKVVERALEWVTQGTSPHMRRFGTTFLTSVVLVHVVLAVSMFPMRARGIVAVREALERAENSVPTDPAVTEKTVIYANPPGDAFASYVPILRATSSKPRPEAQRWLATGLSTVRIDRVGERTLRVHPEGGFLPSSMERMLRSPEYPMHRGQVVEVDGMTVRVTELTRDGRPATARIEFDRPLEHPSFVWLQWRDGGYAPFEPPPVGESARLEPVDFARATFGS